MNEATKAKECMRFGRAVELYERTLAAAEAALPQHDSLIVAELLNLSAESRCIMRAHAAVREAGFGFGDTDAWDEAEHAAWREDGRALALCRRALALLHDRWRAGTLLTPSPQEREYFAATCNYDAHNNRVVPDAVRARLINAAGAHVYIDCAADAAVLWPPLPSAAEDDARVRAIYGACGVALHMRTTAHGLASTLLTATAGLSCLELLQYMFGSEPSQRSLLQRMRDACGMTHNEEALLRALAQALEQNRGIATDVVTWDAQREVQLAVADLARHGLRRCALPGCGATEAHPKAFKVCGRCKAAAYCSAAHQQADWRRHKRAEGGCSQQGA
jgi:hypothetical protein